MTSKYEDILGIGDVNDMEITRERINVPLPKDPAISWMANAVRKMRIDGSRLNEVFLFADESFYKFYHVPRIDITYPFKIDANSGCVRISYLFVSAKADEDVENHELVWEIASVQMGKRANIDAKKSIKLIVDKAVQKLIDSEFKKIVAERNANAENSP
ncbi:hypothetical protein [Azospirillum largimobile]